MTDPVKKEVMLDILEKDVDKFVETEEDSSFEVVEEAKE